MCLIEEEEKKRALKTFEKVSRLREEAEGFGSLKTILSNKIRAELLIQMNRIEEGLALLTQLQDWCRKVSPCE